MPQLLLRLRDLDQHAHQRDERHAGEQAERPEPARHRGCERGTTRYETPQKQQRIGECAALHRGERPLLESCRERRHRHHDERPGAGYQCDHPGASALGPLLTRRGEERGEHRCEQIQARDRPQEVQMGEGLAGDHPAPHLLEAQRSRTGPALHHEHVEQRPHHERGHDPHRAAGEEGARPLPVRAGREGERPGHHEEHRHRGGDQLTQHEPAGARVPLGDRVGEHMHADHAEDREDPGHVEDGQVRPGAA